MKLYLANLIFEHEADYSLGVFSSQEKADKAIEDWLKDNTNASTLANQRIWGEVHPLELDIAVKDPI